MEIVRGIENTATLPGEWARTLDESLISMIHPLYSVGDKPKKDVIIASCKEIPIEEDAVAGEL